MVIKNYTTTIAVDKTLMEIEKILAKAGATHIFKMYDEQGEPTSLAFRSLVGDKSLAFKLPMEEDKILQVFKNLVHKGDLPKRYLDNREQARRTCWRIIKDRIDSQTALMSINVVKLEEIFLPYLYDMNKNVTLYEQFKNQGFNFQIEDKNNK